MKSRTRWLRQFRLNTNLPVLKTTGCLLIGCLLTCLLTSPTVAQDSKPTRAESIFPASAKSLVIVRNAPELREKLESSTLAELGEIEELKPFIAELQRLLEEKLFTSGGRLGVGFTDVKDLVTGEIAFSSLLPDPDGHAVAMSADMSGNVEKAEALVEKIRKGLKDRGAIEEDTLSESEKEIFVYRLPWKKEGLDPRINRVYLTLTEGHLVASNHEETARDIVRCILGTQPEEFKTFADTEVHSAVNERLAEAKGSDSPDIRWYMEPFGFSTAIRNTLPAGERKTHYLGILNRQGFDVIKGLGGDLVFGHEDLEVLHRSFIYAPAETDDEETRFQKAAQLMSFPNSDMASMTPASWVLPQTSTYITFNWDMLKAFDSVGGLVDEIVGSPGAFDRMLTEMKEAHDGPKVDIRNSLVANFAPRFTMISDVARPVELNSERVMIAIPIKDAATVQAGLDKIMIVEPGAVKKEVEGMSIWHIDPTQIESNDIEIDPIFDGFGDPGDAEVEEEDEDESSLAGWNSFCVHDGKLLIANHMDLIVESFAAPHEETLASSEQYKRIAMKTSELVDGKASFHQFGRMDEILRVPFELLRQGRMPESQSILGSILNRQLGTNEPGELRKQEISPDALPKGEDAFDKLIMPHLGPSGWVGVTEEDGWFFTGGVLPRTIESQVATPIEKPESEADTREADASNGKSDNESGTIKREENASTDVEKPKAEGDSDKKPTTSTKTESSTSGNPLRRGNGN